MKDYPQQQVAIVVVTLLSILSQTNVLGNTPPAGSQDICRYFPNNTQIRDPESCNRYITCIDFISHYGECKGTTPFYNKDTQKCVKAIEEDAYCQVSCEGFANQFIEDPSSCKGYYYCYDEKTPAPGKCPGDTHFNSTQQACIHKFESECKIEQFDFCDIVKNGVNIWDEKQCHQYYTCTKGAQTKKTCSKKYYDAAKGACVDKATVECAEHPLPANVCGTEKKPLANTFVDDGATCRGFFYCAKMADGRPDPNPTWGQCKEDTFFNDKKQACVNPLDYKCAWDRCDGRTKTFVTSGKKGCRNYLRCRDGIAAQELSCGNLFFDEKSGTCTTEIVNVAACNT